MPILAVLIGGLIGGSLRYLLTCMLAPTVTFPVAVLGVNLCGSLCLGILYAISDVWHMRPWVRHGLGTGIIGAFTTFSTFCTDTEHLLTISVADAGLYTAATFIGGPVLALTGMWLVTAWTKRGTKTAEELSL